MNAALCLAGTDTKEMPLFLVLQVILCYRSSCLNFYSSGQDLMFSEEDAEYSEALKMGPISAAVLDGDPKEPRVGMVTP